MHNARLGRELILMLLVALVPLRANGQSQSLAEDLGRQNQAFITQIGEAQRAGIEEHNIRGGLLYGSIKQNGIGNNSNISLQGGDLSGSIVQNGNDNQATLEIRGHENRGVIEQYGDRNSVGLEIQGEGKDVTLIQQGNDHIYAGSIKVGGETPAGLPISIRQY